MKRINQINKQLETRGKASHKIGYLMTPNILTLSYIKQAYYAYIIVLYPINKWS